MLHLLKRHPFAVEAYFDFVFVLTYALPKEMLEPLLAPGLVLDTFGNYGFIAVAMVNTRHMRPKGMPEFLGRDFFLIGYRIFVRYRTAEGRMLRGLRILRSEADKSFMVAMGNLLTHYRYHRTNVSIERNEDILRIKSDSLSVTAHIDDSQHNELPEGSPFATVRDALKFAGPMPFTFDYEKETRSIIRVEGVRDDWHPQLVPVEVERITFFNHPQFHNTQPILCSAFYLHDVPYWWKPGVVERVTE